MDFSEALVLIKAGHSVYRSGWTEPAIIKIEDDEIVMYDEGRKCALNLFNDDLMADDWVKENSKDTDVMEISFNPRLVRKQIEDVFPGKLKKQ